MIRRFNYTGRKRVPRDQIHITVFKTSEGPEFDATVKTAKLGIPGGARLFIEAYHKSEFMRFDFGTLAEQRPPPDRHLSAFYEGARILFRVKIVDGAEAAGKIIAEADQIKPASPDDTRNRDPLLPVRLVAGMGDQIWRVTWSAGPVLELNNREPEIKALITADARFKTLILPEILRSVLTRVLMADVDGDPDTEEGRIAARWLDFGENLYPVQPPEKPDRDLADIENWADAVVSAFCRRNAILGSWQNSLRIRQDQLAL